MKKFLKLFSLLLIATMGLSACGSGEKKESTSNETKKEEVSKEKTDTINYQISFSGSSTLAPVISKISTDKLSGGQRQRLCIARMLTTEPEILIFDEPCSSLDLENTLIIENLIKKLSKKYTIIIATHNVEQANRIADRILKIENKKIIC